MQLGSWRCQRATEPNLPVSAWRFYSPWPCSFPDTHPGPGRGPGHLCQPLPTLVTDGAELRASHQALVPWHGTGRWRALAQLSTCLSPCLALPSTMAVQERCKETAVGFAPLSSAPFVRPSRVPRPL